MTKISQAMPQTDQALKCKKRRILVSFNLTEIKGLISVRRFQMYTDRQ